MELCELTDSVQVICARLESITVDLIDSLKCTIILSTAAVGSLFEGTLFYLAMKSGVKSIIISDNMISSASSRVGTVSFIKQIAAGRRNHILARAYLDGGQESRNYRIVSTLRLETHIAERCIKELHEEAISRVATRDIQADNASLKNGLQRWIHVLSTCGNIIDEIEITDEGAQCNGGEDECNPLDAYVNAYTEECNKKIRTSKCFGPVTLYTNLTPPTLVDPFFLLYVVVTCLKLQPGLKQGESVNERTLKEAMCIMARDVVGHLFRCPILNEKKLRLTWMDGWDGLRVPPMKNGPELTNMERYLVNKTSRENREKAYEAYRKLRNKGIIYCEEVTDKCQLGIGVGKSLRIYLFVH